jgi:tetratricopeptide (TPR) repeat protein
MRQRNPEQAEFVARQIVAQCPTYNSAYDALCYILAQAGRYLELETLCIGWVEHCPDHIAAHLNLSTALRQQQQHVRAIQSLQVAMEMEPDNVVLLNQLATLHKEIGECSKALVLDQRIIALDPEFAEAYWNRADLYAEVTESELDRMQNIAANPALPASKKAYLYYAIARGYEHQQRHSESFKYIALGAKNKHSTFKHNHAVEMAMMARIPEVFTADLYANQHDINNSNVPIFICGLPRSGTTLVEHIISSHSQVIAGDELFELARATENYLSSVKVTTAYPDWVPTVPQEAWQAIGDDYLSLTKRLQTQRHFTDKMPLNYKALGIVKLALPRAKIIHCSRHPLDNLFGCYKQLFGDGLAFTYDLTELADTYLMYREVMRHWYQLFPNQILDVQYESLVRDQEGQTRRILDFLGLEWSQDCLDFHRNSRVVHTASNSQVRKPLFSSSIGRWRNYEKELAVLSERLAAYL